MPEPVVLFGLGTTSTGVFADQFRSWLRQRNRRRKVKTTLPTIAYVSAFKTSLPVADIYLFETVPTFISMRQHLPATAVAVIADSPLLLSEIPGLRPLDWVRDAWRFRITPVDYPDFETLRGTAGRHPHPERWQHLAPVGIDRLGLIIEETASGEMLTPVNSVMFQLNFIDRNIFRKALATYLAGLGDLVSFERAARSLIAASHNENQVTVKSLSEIFDKLKTQGPLYQQAIACVIAKKSPAKHLKGTKITPFELKFLTRMVTTSAVLPKAPAKAA